MSDFQPSTKRVLEVISPDNPEVCFLSVSPFCIGRGESGIISSLADSRISLQCAALTPGDFVVSLDLGHLQRVL